MAARSATGSVDLHLGSDAEHLFSAIDNSLPPVATVASGTTISADCPGLPLPPEATVDDLLANIDPSAPHKLVGPIAVEGAEPGDVLAVEILEVTPTEGCGHTAIVPGHGLLGDDYDKPYVHNFTLVEGRGYTELKPGVRIPLNPFCGQIGVLPAQSGKHSTIPPRETGGNMDVRHLVPGSTVYLPVQVPDAMFFIGDGHGAQGDGEVCISGLETAVRAVVHLTVQKGRTIQEPQFVTYGELSIDAGDRGYHGTTACGPDLYEASQRAIRYMVDYLEAEHGLTREEGLVLCSLVVDLKISEIVDAPNWLVSAVLPLSVFAGEEEAA